MQNNVFPTVFYMWNCGNGCNVTLGHDMFFDITNCLHELGTVARRQFKSTSAIALPNRLPE